MAKRRLPDETGLTAMGKRLNAAVLDAAKTSVEICIGLIGIMALWLGLLNVAKDAGLIDAFARLLRPLMRWLFPEVPDGHPAQGAMLMNLSANMLGLDNAATPMGLKAMDELQTLNPVKDTATNSMAHVPGDQLRQHHADSVHDHRFPRAQRQPRSGRSRSPAR